MIRVSQIRQRTGFFDAEAREVLMAETPSV
jgi:hypothetical protein